MALAATQPTQVATGFPFGVPPHRSRAARGRGEGVCKRLLPRGHAPQALLPSHTLHHKHTQTGHGDSCLLHVAS